jgi:dCMP deaminase
MDFDQIWMEAALEARRCSHDPHHQVGSAIVARDGRHIVAANRIPSKLKRDVADRLERPTKAGWICHAESMAVCSAARAGIPTALATIFSTRFPCDGCALFLIASGIAEVVSPAPDFDHPRWGLSFRAADEKFREACVLTRRPREAEDGTHEVPVRKNELLERAA